MGTKGWHNRGYLPHYDSYQISQHVVFRLFDSIPPNEREGDDVLDRHLGSSFMRDPACARIVAEALLHGDGDRYVLQAWCVMPNHVHALIATNASTALGQIVHAWKRFTTRRMNEHLGRTGPAWAKDYFDRYVRDDRHFETTKAYIENKSRRRGSLRHAGSLAFLIRGLALVGWSAPPPAAHNLKHRANCAAGGRALQPANAVAHFARERENCETRRPLRKGRPFCIVLVVFQ